MTVDGIVRTKPGTLLIAAARRAVPIREVKESTGEGLYSSSVQKDSATILKFAVSSNPVHWHPKAQGPAAISPARV